MRVLGSHHEDNAGAFVYQRAHAGTVGLRWQAAQTVGCGSRSAWTGEWSGFHTQRSLFSERYVDQWFYRTPVREHR